MGTSWARGEEPQQGFGAHWDEHQLEEEVGRAGWWEGGGEEGLLWQPFLGDVCRSDQPRALMSSELVITKKDLPLLPGQELWFGGFRNKMFNRRLKLCLLALSFRWHHCHLLLFARSWQRAAAELCLPRTPLLVGPPALPISSALCTWNMGSVSGLWGEWAVFWGRCCC